MELLADTLEKLADAEHKKCIEQHDIVETGTSITRAIKVANVSALVGGIGARKLMRYAVAYAVEQRNKCERFELDYSSQITYTAPTGTGVSIVRAQGLKLNRDNNWTNEAPLDYWYFDYPPICTYTRRVVDAF